jgi:hypothetical protein
MSSSARRRIAAVDRSCLCFVSSTEVVAVIMFSSSIYWSRVHSYDDVFHLQTRQMLNSIHQTFAYVARVKWRCGLTRHIRVWYYGMRRQRLCETDGAILHALSVLASVCMARARARRESNRSAWREVCRADRLEVHAKITCGWSIVSSYNM